MHRQSPEIRTSTDAAAGQRRQASSPRGAPRLHEKFGRMRTCPGLCVHGHRWENHGDESAERRETDGTCFLSSDNPLRDAQAALCGRAGCDVTPAPSASATSARATAPRDHAGGRARRRRRADGVATHEADAERYAAAWHAARRKAITLAHLEVARLAERRPQDGATPLIPRWPRGECCTRGCAAATHLPLGVDASSSATRSAPLQDDAVRHAHDICHGSAGEFVELEHCTRLRMLYLLCRISMGGETQMYYAYQHLGNRALWRLGLPREKLPRRRRRLASTSRRRPRRASPRRVRRGGSRSRGDRAPRAAEARRV